jgi:hypothetical protein
MVSVGVVSGNRRSDDLRDMGTILRLRCISYSHREVVAIIILPNILMMTRIWITLVLMTGYYCPLPAVFGQPATNQYVLAMNAAVNAGNHQEVAAISKAWYKAGLFSQSVLNWNFNALVSLE